MRKYRKKYDFVILSGAEGSWQADVVNLTGAEGAVDCVQIPGAKILRLASLAQDDMVFLFLSPLT